jgi:CheY-like chemotaxis protein
MSARSDLDRQAFDDAVVDLYRNLYDLVALRTHYLGEVLVPAGSDLRSDRGWRLHKLLLDVVEELNPGPDAPAFSVPWRRYHLLLSRYVDGMGPEDVARELAISRRQFFREQKEALEIVADLLWRRFVAPEPDQDNGEASTKDTDVAAVERLELLRIEAARVKRSNHSARIDEVADGVISIMQDVLDRRAISLTCTLSKTTPIVAVAPSLLRQILLSVLGYLTSYDECTAIRIWADTDRTYVTLNVSSELGGLQCTLSDAGNDYQIEALAEIVALSQARLCCRCMDDKLTGVEIALPVARRTIVILDDNRDTLELFTRYLESSHYRVVTSTEAEDVLKLARDLHPDVILLDLMMPEQDGWDVLQMLLYQTMTRDIPVVICSVLKQKTLALSLGATAFLEKPVDKQTLISTIRSLS